MADVLQFPKQKIHKDAIIQKLTNFATDLVEHYAYLDTVYEALNKAEDEGTFKENMYNSAVKELIRIENGIETIDPVVLEMATDVKTNAVVGEENMYVLSIEVDGKVYNRKLEGDLDEDDSEDPDGAA